MLKRASYSGGMGIQVSELVMIAMVFARSTHRSHILMARRQYNKLQLEL